MTINEDLVQSIVTSRMSTDVWQTTLSELHGARIISERDASRIAAAMAELFPVSVTLSEVAESATFESLLDPGQQLGSEFDLEKVVRKLLGRIPTRVLGSTPWRLFAVYGFASAVHEHNMNGAVLGLAILAWASLQEKFKNAKGSGVEAPGSIAVECQHLLFSLMRDLFTNDELRRLLYFLPEGRRIVDSLPSAHESRADFAFEALLALERHGALDGVLVRELVAARPAAQRYVSKLERCLSSGRQAMSETSSRECSRDTLRLSPLGSEEEQQLVGELARVFYERERAIFVAGAGGCPTQHMPNFSDPSVFWARVVEVASNGSREYGTERLIEAAVREMPNNPVFLRLLRGGTISTRKPA